MVFSLNPMKSFIGKTGGAESLSRGDPLFFRFFPAHKSGGGDKGVGVDCQVSSPEKCVQENTGVGLHRLEPCLEEA